MSNLKISPLQINSSALQICQILQQAGFQAFIVGGCVRDLLLGAVPKDWDITTSAKPQQVIDLFSKTIPTGLQHGTVTVVLNEGIENHFEVTTFRTEGAYLDGRRPEEVFFVNNIEQDLSRRDLTINAIAYDPIKDQLVDPFGGQLDLLNGIIKAVGNPKDRFNEDGLRIMRTARFAARFNYKIEEETENAMSECLDTLHKVSKERIKDELCKTLESKHPNIGLKFLYGCQALDFICPYLIQHISYRQLLLQDLILGELETRIAFLYKECKHPFDVVKELNNLKFSNKEIIKVRNLLDLSSKFSYLRLNWSLSAYKEFTAYLLDMVEHNPQSTLIQFITLMEAQGIPISRYLLPFENVKVFSRKEMNINGHDLISLGIAPGPKMKLILDKCYKEILDHPEHNTKEFLLKFVQ